MPVLPGIAVDAEIGTSDKAPQEDVGEGYAFHVQADTAAVNAERSARGEALAPKDNCTRETNAVLVAVVGKLLSYRQTRSTTCMRALSGKSAGAARIVMRCTQLFTGPGRPRHIMS